jgi:ChrR-like protein with cupin domain
MPRPHIEFIQTQNVDWSPCSDGTECKILNADPDSTEATLIVRYPPGYSAGGHRRAMPAEEYFVLDGSIDMGGKPRGLHAYGFLPGGEESLARSTRYGATVLIFRYAEDDPNSLEGTAEAVSVDTMEMPWDVSGFDPNLEHLRLARKVLREAPNNSCRTWLLAGMPHGVPSEANLPAETHKHCEEMFMITGSMWAPEGLMQPGAYFFRPPHILHGPHVSEMGFFQIMRSPMANKVATDWSEEYRPLPIGAEYSPVVPEATPRSWTRSWTPSSEY